MSIFQCNKCGCAENTALTHMSHCVYMMNSDLSSRRASQETIDALMSYKQILGLKPDEEFKKLCSACSPIWFNAHRNYGVGPNPDPQPGIGLWHGEFERIFLPKGQFITDRYGNLAHEKTGDTDIKKYQLPKEEGT